MKAKLNRLPVTFSKSGEVVSKDTRFINVVIDVLHTGENLNGSIFDKESVNKAADSIKNRPILGYIEKNQAGDIDFKGHEHELVIEDDNIKYVYAGSAYGVIPESCNPRWVVKDDGKGVQREYFRVDGLLWTKFDDSCDIFERDIAKNQSMEICNIDGYVDKNGYFVVTSYVETNKKIQGNEELFGKYNSISSSISSALKTGDVVEMTNAINKQSAAVSDLKKRAQELGLEGKTLSQVFQDLFGQHFNTMVAMAALHLMQDSLRQVYQNVLDIDTAMTELKKVTDETSASYEAFLNRSADTAKQLGADVSDLINTTADWARLGYSVDESEELAKVSTLYKNVGDSIESASQASEYLISTLKGFNMDASDAQHILDVINAVSNTQPVSAQDLGEIMQRSSAAMSAANNTMEETIALATAMNSVLQDSARTGTTLKTVSMYLRATDTELEQAGESTEGMAESTSKLRQELLALTHGKVDIQLDEDTYKSTYQILKEMSYAWDDMTDKEHAAALELMGGKRNANAVQAVIQQFQIAEKSLETAQNSAGSAMKENDKYMNSIQGKLTKFQATFEVLSSDLLDSDLVKGVVDLGTGALNAVDGFVKLAGAIPAVTTALAALISMSNIDTSGNKVKMFSYAVEIAA